jgi:hypothetical protein
MGKATKWGDKKSDPPHHSDSFGQKIRHATYHAVHSKAAKTADRTLIGLEHMLGSVEKHEGKWSKILAYGALAVGLTVAFASGVGEGALLAGAAAAEVGGVVGEVAELASLATTATESTSVVSTLAAEGQTVVRGASTLGKASKALAIAQLGTAVGHDTVHAINHSIEEDKKYAHRVYARHHLRPNPEIPDSPSVLPEIEYALTSGQSPTAVAKYLPTLISISSLPPNERATQLMSMGFSYVDTLSSIRAMVVMAPNGQPYVLFPDAAELRSESDIQKSGRVQMAKDLMSSVATYTNRNDAIAIGIDAGDYLAQQSNAPGGAAIYTKQNPTQPTPVTSPTSINPSTVPEVPISVSDAHQGVVNPYSTVTRNETAAQG